MDPAGFIFFRIDKTDRQFTPFWIVLPLTFEISQIGWCPIFFFVYIIPQTYDVHLVDAFWERVRDNDSESKIPTQTLAKTIRM